MGGKYITILAHTEIWLLDSVFHCFSMLSVNRFFFFFSYKPSVRSIIRLRNMTNFVGGTRRGFQLKLKDGRGKTRWWRLRKPCTKYCNVESTILWLPQACIKQVTPTLHTTNYRVSICLTKNSTDTKRKSSTSAFSPRLNGRRTIFLLRQVHGTPWICFRSGARARFRQIDNRIDNRNDAKLHCIDDPRETFANVPRGVFNGRRATFGGSRVCLQFRRNTV